MYLAVYNVQFRDKLTLRCMCLSHVFMPIRNMHDYFHCVTQIINVDVLKSIVMCVAIDSSFYNSISI